MKSCYISASFETTERLGPLRRRLQERGVNVVVPSDLSAAADSSDLTRQTIERADWVLGVITSESGNENVYFELGVAIGLNKRHLLIVEPGIELPLSLQNTLQLRTRLDNDEALNFAVQQMLAAPKPRKVRSKRTQKFRALGPAADRLLAHLNHVDAFRPPLGIEKLVESALKEGGVGTMATSFNTPERWYYDIAVWIDELEPYIGNPLRIEVRYSIATAAIVEEVTRKLTGGSQRWALVLYVTETDASAKLWKSLPPTVLHLRIADLLERMRTETFPDIVRDLRNRVVHGAST